MLFWKPKPKKKAEKPTAKRQIAPSAIELPKDIPHITIPKPEKSAVKGSTVTQAKKPRHYQKEFLTTFKQIASAGYRSFEVWNDFVVMAACALSNPVDKTHFEEREKRYLKIIRKYRKNEQALFPELLAHTVMALEANPEQDFLGSMYMELDLGSKRLQQIFPPYHICQFMAAITVENVAEQVNEHGYISINDPCCGGGATLIAGVNEARKQLEKADLNYQNHVLVVAQDIDECVALMCYIQLSLLGVAGYVKVGDSLTEPMTTGDKLDHYWFMPMYFSNIWTMRRVFRGFDSLMNEKGEKL